MSNSWSWFAFKEMPSPGPRRSSARVATEALSRAKASPSMGKDPFFRPSQESTCSRDEAFVSPSSASVLTVSMQSAADSPRLVLKSTQKTASSCGRAFTSCSSADGPSGTPVSRRLPLSSQPVAQATSQSATVRHRFLTGFAPSIFDSQSSPPPGGAARLGAGEAPARAPPSTGARRSR